MSYELRAHTADVGVAATGETLEATVGAIADGLAGASCESIPDRGERFSLAVSAESLEALLFDYLDELIYLRDVRAELPVDNDVEITEGQAGEWHLEGSARGIPLDAVVAREIKAVTYSEMRLESTDDGWEGYVVFDV